MHQQEHFCFTCEIELEEYSDYFVCPRCSSMYVLDENGDLEKIGYAGEE